MGMRSRGCYALRLRTVILLLLPLQFFFLAASDSHFISDKAVDDTGVSETSRTTRGERPEVHCSRERSRAAWKIVDQHLLPFLHREKYQLPFHCRLDASNGIFREQEEHKIHFDLHEWQCGYCKKSFFQEEYLDKHFDNRHYNLLNTSHGKCLADLCGALHCDHVLNSKSPNTKCNPAAAARNHHLCEELAESCFPLKTSHLATWLHEFFLRQFCDAHTCSSGRKYFSMGGRKGINTGYIVISVLVLILLPVFYAIVYLYLREVRKGTQQLKRMAKRTRSKTKPS